jgi:lipopolysaccharide export system protein LptA
MRRLVALAALALLGFGSAAQAQQIDLSNGGPVEVTSRDGFEWRENEQVVIATGDARAVRGDVTVTADRLIAHYRKKGTGPGGAGGLAPPAPAPAAHATPAAAPAEAPPSAAAATAAGEPDSGGNEVYRLDAEGHVHIFTPTDEAQGDTAVYDIDQAVLVMTGHNLKLTTPQQVMTARDSMEYWSQKHMAVGRGNAVVVTNDGRRLAGDVLVGFTTDPNETATGAQPGGARPAVTKAATGKPADPLAASGKLKRVEAYGNVEVRTQVDTVRGDRGVYIPDTGMARIVGHVRVTHGENQLNGPAADINMKTGIAHMLSGPGQRVEGLIIPNSQPDSGKAAPGKAAPDKTEPGKAAAPQPIKVAP